MVKHLLLLLGMSEGATVADIKKSYARLVDRLSKRASTSSDAADELQPARERLSQSFEHWKKLGVLDGEPAPYTLKTSPKLGQLLVALDRLRLEELMSVLELQRVSKGERFGEILVSYNYISAEELDYFLQLQRIIELPPDHPERWGQRLVELGLITQDQLGIALIEHRRTECTLRTALINRGYLSTEILDRIF